MGTSQSIGIAKDIYLNGAHSKSVATVTLTTALAAPLNVKMEVSGKTDKGVEVNGKLLNDYPTGTSKVEVQYDTISIQSSYVGCRVGANPEPITEGCLAPTGELIINGQTFSYNYDVLSDNGNERTLAGFSTEAEEKMYRCENCPYVTYEKFYQYYGEFDYAHQWIMAAFDGQSTSFANGNADFSGYTETGRAEAIKKGSAYMSVFMYVIREMEDALDDCKSECDIDSCNDDPVHAWDEAVAFYSGSLEGTDGSGSGVLLHQLADKRCVNFKTCGDLANEISGTSHVNLQILAQFVDGKRKLRAGQCQAVRENKNRIEELMAIPLIQGTIRYAYITDFEAPAGEKSEAEGAAFAASVLPLVNACDDVAADTIYKSMQTGQNGRADFFAVKRAFESVYQCMNIRCEDVGGLHDPVSGGYLTHAAPCGTTTEGKDVNVGLAVGLSLGGLAFIAIAFVVSRRYCGTHSTTNGSTDVTSVEKVVA